MGTASREQRIKESMPMNKLLHWTLNSILNSYGQVFFSDNKAFSAVLVAVTFVDFYTGLFGLTAVVVTTAMARWIGFDSYRVSQGYYGFNSLLVGLGMGIYFQPGGLLLMMVVLAGVLTLFMAVAMEGIIGKYQLPHLSLPFVFSLWAIMLASREFQALGLNERGIYTLNELYLLGGHSLVRLYEWWGGLPLPASLRTYFLSLGAIFFQFNMLTGVLVAVGLLIYSRIAFTLSLLGFYTAYLFYTLIGASLSEVSYSYIGFNYILSAIAIGGYFIIPNRSSYLWVVLLIPMVAILTISLSGIMVVYQLPIYSLPFNIMALLFLYVLHFRQHNRARLNTLFVQYNNPEKNLYTFTSFMERFGSHTEVALALPFFGEWRVTQGHDGPHTHKGDWRHAWDFEITDEEGKTYKGSGDLPADYYCYDKAVLAPADGTIETVVDGIDDNVVGQKNLEKNWGNTVVIRHQDQLFTKFSHLKPGSMEVAPGDRVTRGTVLARCGNSGHSPYPHLHFQVQRTPYIGSRTTDYPFSHYMCREGGHPVLRTVALPEAGEWVANIEVHPALKKAFQFIPGERIHLKTGTDKPTEATWEIKQDAWLNKFIECDRSRCKAWFRRDEGMLYFTHFEGRRDNLLYYFYLGAYKVALGNYRQLELFDTFPANRVFPPGRLFLQDFIAPFYRYMKGHYHVRYDSIRDNFSDTRLVLRSQVFTSIFGRRRPLVEVDLKVDNSGLAGFIVRTKDKTTEVLCTKSPS
jgi:urea transporter/murein DD-endopeptidase MepM/ murein hydrolase activator NlpD